LRTPVVADRGDDGGAIEEVLLEASDEVGVGPVHRSSGDVLEHRDESVVSRYRVETMGGPDSLVVVGTMISHGSSSR
jgi:hypothetical protein